MYRKRFPRCGRLSASRRRYADDWKRNHFQRVWVAACGVPSSRLRMRQNFPRLLDEGGGGAGLSETSVSIGFVFCVRLLRSFRS